MQGSFVWVVVSVWVALVLVWSVEGVDERKVPGHKVHKHQESRHHHPKPKPQTKPLPRTDPKRPPPPPIQTIPKLLQDNDLFHDREHLREELPEYLPIEKIQEMSDKELDYHYFRMHDFDGNLLLDGLELLAALEHVVGGHEEEEEEEGQGVGKEEPFEENLEGLSEEEQKLLKSYRYQKWEETMQFYIDLVDNVMEENDLNKDGYLSWAEFLSGRKRNI